MSDRGKADLSPKASFFGERFRALHIVLAVLTLGIWLLALLSAWLWRTNRRRPAVVAAAAFAFIASALVAGLASESSTTTRTHTSERHSSPKMTDAARASADKKAKAAIALALNQAASDYQDFGGYTLVSPYTLGNADPRLRHTPSLHAEGNGMTFEVSVRSSSGTTFIVNGNRLSLRRSCKPAGVDCPNGTWPGPSNLKLPKVPVLSSEDKREVRSVLTASVDHYLHLLRLGEQALGETQYASAMEGLEAFEDPNSAASRFSDYRKRYRPETDLSYEDAFSKADKYYTAANEPRALERWRYDMTKMTELLYSWPDFASAWQIGKHTTAELQAREAKIELQLLKSRHDIDMVIAGR